MTSSAATRILVVEDDQALAFRVKEFLEKHAFSASLEARGLAVTGRLRKEPFDLVVLDWMLPDCDGLDVCRSIKMFFSQPVLMLTARGGDHDEVRALEGGADDYLAKPVRPRVLLARVRALLRRSGATGSGPVQATASGSLINGPLTIVPHQRAVTMSGQPIELTTAEYDLLLVLARNAGCALSRDELYLTLRGIVYDGQDRSLDLRVARIRKKLGDSDDSGRLIKGVRSVGYMMVRLP